MKHVIGLLVLGAALWISAPASAQQTTGYVCAVRYIPINGPAGKLGHIEAFFNSQPWCGGVQTAHRYYCSLDATSTNCPRSNAYQHTTRDSIISLVEQLQSAGQLGNRVLETPIGSNNAGYYVTFYSN
ncbi:MAG TPA: hypothetical protein VK509_21190 [Polyangiales bacterium]|nr:hypothetical protein [Polyangiales bacterium]